MERKRPSQWFQSKAGREKEKGPVALAGPSVNHADSVEKPCVSALAGLALRQPGARPPSLEDVAAYTSLFEGLLQFVLLPGCCEFKGILSIAEWVRFVSMVPIAPATLRLFCPMWWRTYPKLVLTQHFNSRELMPVSAHTVVPARSGVGSEGTQAG